MWSRVRVRVGALAALVLAGPAVLALSGPAQAEPAPGPVVVVGASGVTWQDLTPGRMPAMASLVADAAIAHLSVRSVYPVTCPVDAWLTLGSGRRSAVERDPAAGADDGTCPPIPPLRDSEVVGWRQLAEQNASSPYAATLGLLGQAAADADRCVLGAGSGGVLAAADEGGRVARSVADPSVLLRSDLAECDLTLVDLGGVDERAPDAAPRTEQLARLDEDLAQLLRVVPPDATVLLVAGANAAPTAELQVSAIRGPGFPPGLLRSPSTKQDGLILLTDLTPTLFDLLGLPPTDQLVGAPVTSVPAQGDWLVRRAQLLDAARKVHVYGEVAQPFFTALVLLQLPLYAWAAWAFRRRPEDSAGRRRVLRVTGWVAVVCGSVPVATFLANLLPWWRWDPPEVWLVTAVLAWATLVGGLARRLGRRSSLMTEMGIVSAVTASVLSLDIVTGGSLQTASLMGYSPIIAGRLYGFGNVAFALFATSMLFVAGWLADVLLRRGRPSAATNAVVGLGVVALVLDGLPSFGSDFGGVIALVTGFGVLVLGVRRIRITVWRTLLLMGVGVLVVVAVSVVDWLRPREEQSHLGRFVQQVLDGELFDVVGRKIASNLDILFSSLVPIAVLFLVLVLLRPVGRATPVLREAFARAPVLRPVLTAWLVTMAVGFAVNDSGIAIPGVGIMLTVPLLIALSVRVLEEPDPAPARARGPGPAADVPTADRSGG